MNRVQRFTSNPRGRDFIVADLHGMIDMLERALFSVNFNPDNGDRLFSVGDLVDRGPLSHSVLDLVDKPWFHAVRGNHEQMLIDYYTKQLDAAMYVRNGGAWYFDLSEQHKADFYRHFSALPYAIEIEGADFKVGIVHAGCPVPDWAEFCDRLEDGDEAVMEAALWSRNRVRDRDQSIVAGIELIVCGHTVVEIPLNLGNHLFIDTGAVFNKKGIVFFELNVDGGARGGR